jgi:peptidoglycan/LPS O-acetylase OafA/YrhL
MRNGLFSRLFSPLLRARLRQAIAGATYLPRRGSHLSHLDGWRGICILLVIAGHFIPGMGLLGVVGVEFFFVLSGRLMAEILIFKRQPIGLFIKRRIARVVPALAFYVLVAGTVINAIFLYQGSSLQLLSPAAALLFFHNYLPLSADVPGFEHTWSLAVEEHSYLLLVLIAVVSRRNSRVAAGIAIGICVLTFLNALRLSVAPAEGAQFIVWRSDVRVASVLMSFAFCVLMQRGPAARRLISRSWLAPVAAILTIACAFADEAITPVQLTICTVLSAIAVNGLSTSSPAFRNWLEHPFLVWAGTLSFSLYLWQQVFYWFTFAGLPKPVGLVLAVGCALWSFKRVEEPSRNYLNVRWARHDGDRQPEMTALAPAPVEACTLRAEAVSN